jgi:1,2-diacylglycerol-3-alpha-glucose alpha-1,2-galactosyltransferase
MPQVLNMADVFFFPSYQENHPVAVIEAASVKLPLILRNIKEYEDIFFNNYLKGSSVEEYINHIKSLKENKPLYDTFMNLSDEMARVYDVKTVTKQLVAHYQEVYDNYKKK